jgi:murein DD-endopeptidase MepM/ murein hydrolase activator NlpD
MGSSAGHADQRLGLGNSGNSAEPHLHFQLMDHPSVLLVAGLPSRFQSADGGPATLPRNGQHLLAHRAGTVPCAVAAANP